jgi:hypothetical protein
VLCSPDALVIGQPGWARLKQLPRLKSLAIRGGGGNDTAPLFDPDTLHHPDAVVLVETDTDKCAAEQALYRRCERSVQTLKDAKHARRHTQRSDCQKVCSNRCHLNES